MENQWFRKGFRGADDFRCSPCRMPDPYAPGGCTCRGDNLAIRPARVHGGADE
jgi:hypothetical protein